MPDYNVYGGCLRSDIAFPHLSACIGRAPDWIFRRSDGPLQAEAAEFLGEKAVDRARVALYRHPRGYRLHYSDTGCFDVLAGGTTIVWHPGPEPDLESVWADVLGLVFAVALHALGRLCLHASAVSINGAAIAFAGPRFHGKSTLALALARGGARLLTDDTLAVTTGSPVLASPGVHSVRLWQDSCNELRAGVDARAVLDGVKHTLAHFPERLLMRESSRLVTVYDLKSVRYRPGVPPVRRTALNPGSAAMCVLAQAKLGALFNPAEARLLLQRAAALVRHVSVYRLEVGRDFACLADVVAQLLEWHRAAEPAPHLSSEGAP